jgi:hypothetical protein
MLRKNTDVYDYYMVRSDPKNGYAEIVLMTAMNLVFLLIYETKHQPYA